MTRRDPALPADELRRPKRNNGAGGDVQAETVKTARPRIHQSQRGLILIADRKAEHPVPGLEIEDHVRRDLAMDGLFDVAHAAARRDHERRPGSIPVSAAPADTGKNDVLLEHLIADEGLTPRPEEVDPGRPDQVEEDGPEATEVRSRREAARRDEDEISSGAQPRGAHRHEEGVDVGLTVNHRGGGDSARVGLADLEVRRVGDDDIEVFGLRPAGEQPTARMQHPGIRQDEVSGLDTNDERYAASPAPVGEAVENRPQRRDQLLVDFMGDQFDDARLRPSRNQRLHGRATENAGPGRRVEDPELPSLRPDPSRHEVGGADRRQEEAVLLAMPVGLACGIPFADAVGIDRRSFAFARSRHREGFHGLPHLRLLLQHPHSPPAVRQRSAPRPPSRRRSRPDRLSRTLPHGSPPRVRPAQSPSTRRQRPRSFRQAIAAIKKILTAGGPGARLTFPDRRSPHSGDDRAPRIAIGPPPHRRRLDSGPTVPDRRDFAALLRAADELRRSSLRFGGGGPHRCTSFARYRHGQVWTITGFRSRQAGSRRLPHLLRLLMAAGGPCNSSRRSSTRHGGVVAAIVPAPWNEREVMPQPAAGTAARAQVRATRRPIHRLSSWSVRSGRRPATRA